MNKCTCAESYFDSWGFYLTHNNNYGSYIDNYNNDNPLLPAFSTLECGCVRNSFGDGIPFPNMIMNQFVWLCAKSGNVSCPTQ